MEIRRNPDNSIDEIVANGASVHIEDMGGGEWFLRIDEGDRWWIFFQHKGKWSLFESSDES
jgi:hypothetical protein